MHNQDTDLSQTLADQHRTPTPTAGHHQRPLLVARQRRRRRSWSPRRWWQLRTRRPSRAS
jgi:hypothetical protein